MISTGMLALKILESVNIHLEITKHVLLTSVHIVEYFCFCVYSHQILFHTRPPSFGYGLINAILVEINFLSSQHEFISVETI